ncbi:segregation/condensation protein A [candidate division WOR-3 bacterium]|nr:segregation/condensation protein A [candidate division WOR-3 bacterium]
MSEHEVNLDLFEGPVELLLWLVRKNELDILDVPVARLTDDFLGYVRAAHNLQLETASDFLVMAGILLRLKMRQLLPRPKEEDLDTTTVTLEQILDEFRRYQHAARVLHERETERRDLFPRPGGAVPAAPVADSEDLAVLTAAFRRVLENIKPGRLHEVAPRKVRFEDKLDDLRRLLRARRRVRFEEAVSGSSLTELIVMFIAVLELTRLGELRVSQDDQFGTIILELADGPAPDPA